MIRLISLAAVLLTAVACAAPPGSQPTERPAPEASAITPSAAPVATPTTTPSAQVTVRPAATATSAPATDSGPDYEDPDEYYDY